MSLPNIYGRKPSALVKIEGNEFIRSFDSRRQAIFWRRNNVGDPRKYKIIPNGAQEPDSRFAQKKEDPEKRKDGKADEQRHNRKGAPDRAREGAQKGSGSPTGDRQRGGKGKARVPRGFAKGEGVVGSFV